MLYKDQKTTVPSNSKLLTRGGHTYVYHVINSVYKPIKQYNIEKRICIGKLIPNSKFMFPNDNYFLYYGNESIVLNENTNLFSDTISIGNIIALRKVSNDIGLNTIINKIFPDKADLIKSICHYIIDEQSSVMQLFSKWAFNNLHYLDTIPSQATISNLFNNYFSPSMITDFILAWTNNIINRADCQKILLSLDSTNMNIHSSNIKLAEYGLPKMDEGLNQVNLAYAINQDTGLPVFYNLYPGSINDVSQCKLLIQRAFDYGLKEVCFVIDRGYFSQGNIEFFTNNNYDFIAMAKNDIKGYHTAFEEYAERIKNNAVYYIHQHEIYGVKISTQTFSASTQNYFCYFYYNDEKAAAERHAYNSMIKSFIENLSKTTKLTDEIKLTYGKYLNFITDKNRNIQKIEINQIAQQEALLTAGYFMIVSNLSLPLETVIELYRKRDIIEKTFRTLKSNLDANKYYASNDIVIESKVLVHFMSAIIRAQLLYRIKPYTALHSEHSVNSVLAELSKIQATKINGVYRMQYALTSKQKEILKHIEINETDIEDTIKRINRKL